ncbi:MAG: hypothetical protein P1P85_04115 [Patescibacteria group bacterium]|nr:hypothetical protein [Patescibacteria group bacterium]
MIDDLVFEALNNAIKKSQEKKYNKNIYEAKYGKVVFLDSLSEQRAYKDYADRLIKSLDF